MADDKQHTPEPIRRSERIRGFTDAGSSYESIEKPAEKEMLKCGKCDTRHHFEQAENISGIENERWVCKKCESKTIVIESENLSSRSTTTPTESTMLSKRKTLRLQMLEEEKVLQEKRDKEYLRKKFQLLEEDSDDEGETGIQEPKCLSKAEKQLFSKAENEEEINFATQRICDDNMAGILSVQQKRNIAQTASVHDIPSFLSNPVLEEYARASETTHRQLTNNQIAARQAITKDLPCFSGNPDEWPLFISAYERSTTMCGFCDDENLMRLQRCLRGKALELVRSRLLLPTNVPGIISTLRMIYGRPEVIIYSLIEKIRREPTPRSEKLETIISFALSVQNICATMEAAHLEDHLANPVLLRELTDMLPPQMKLNWATYKRTLSFVNLSMFSGWISEIAETVSDVTYTPAYFADNVRQFKERRHVNTHSEINRICKICNRDCYSVEKCMEFKRMNLNDRWAIVKRLRLCRTCLISHTGARCQSNKQCGVSGCIYRHHSALHKYANEVDKPQSTAPAVSLTTTQNCNAQRATLPILFRIVPVTLRNDNVKIDTFAFLDEGSSITMIDSSLAAKLKLSGPTEPLCLKWTGTTHRNENKSQVVSLKISAANNDKTFIMRNVRTVGSLNLPRQSLNVSDLISKYTHLKGIPLRSYEHAVPQILIGLDNRKLGFPLKIREGGAHEPAATKTRLGWVIYGTNGEPTNQKGLPHYTYQICECEDRNEHLQSLMKEYFSLESLGVTAPSNIVKSESENRACQLLEAGTFRVGERFVTPLLWKYDEFSMPDSFPMALKRYNCLREKLLKDTTLADNLRCQMNNYLARNYIRRLSAEELEKELKNIWYLPIFTVTNQHKPGKLRIVWDAAAKVGGVSLNSMLLKGPDHLTSLLSVLFRFRERQIGISGDIREMFHQVLVKEEDQQAQRFLWSSNLEFKPDVYVMQVLTFGATCSPSCAQFVKIKNAQEFQHQYPRAVQSIIEHHYVDDLLDSVNTEEEAIALAKEVKYVHSKAGFEIRNWISNCPSVMKEFNEGHTETTTLNLCPEEESADRVLGMWWCTSSDSFTFVPSTKPSIQQLLQGNTRPTKREVLRVMMATFDPLGLIANFLINIKILMQYIWRSGIDWDDLITDEHNEKWILWLSHLTKLNQIKIPRCYFTNIRSGESKTLQLHVFVDASESAFVAVAYLRVSIDNYAECNIIASKTRVAPLKMASIPRLELEAARLGARLAKSVEEGHDLKFASKYFWSDSKTVLCWIRSDHRKYRQFVAFRVSEILEMTKMQQWRYVPTKLNVADDATRDDEPDLSSASRWFNGPTFLAEPEEKWPRDILKHETVSDELRAHLLHHSETKSNVIQVQRFSNWRRLVRTTIFVFRFMWNISARKRERFKRTGILSKDEYLHAENYLFRQAQSDHYSDEIACLINNKNLPIGDKISLEKRSPLYNLSPYLDENDIIRCHGRIDAATRVAENMKRPIILPREHHITRLIVRSYHRLYHHHNHETVVNEVRQKFIIPRLRVALNKERRVCQTCKNQRARPEPPEMAALPSARLSSFSRPFSYIGLDYFGPMMVAIGRRSEKRWGVLITCLTTRAIHVEVAASLTSDSCILAIKRFIARRGVPLEIRCDNGTNFHGAERELREATRQQNTRLAEEFSCCTTKWIFNPPGAPHMGGSWERLVRSVKKILYQIRPTRNPTDEVLHSTLVEIEKTINTRPLTYLPIDHENEEALTPNHFLLGSSNGEKPEVAFCDDNTILRKNWLKSQQLANIFWRRWLREYLPTITRRSKWFQKVKPIEIGDVVIIVDETNPRNTWPKGRVLTITAGKDAQVRKAVVQTATGVYERPTVKLAVLDVLKKGKPGDAPVVPGGSVGNAIICESYEGK